MVIAVEGHGFVHDDEEEEGGRPIRYLPLGHVYSSSTPAPSPRPPAQKKPRFDDLNPPMKVYYRRRRKKLRVDESLSPPPPTTAPLAPMERDEEAGPSRRKGSLKHELLSLSSASPALDGDRDGKEPERRQGRTRRCGGADKSVCFLEPERRRLGMPKGSVGRRWVE